jgi:AraC-like DNA-binding protein
MLDRVLRFQRFVSLAATASGRRLVLTHAAADLGYADQAHLSRECLRLSGLTPTQLIAEQSPPRDRVIVRE